MDLQGVGAAADLQGVGEHDRGLPPERSGHRLRRRKDTDYNNVGATAPHLKTVGYNALMSGAKLLSTTLKAYVHVAHAITTYANPKHCDMQHIMLSQYGLKKGLRLFGEDGEAAVTKELQQLHDREVLEPKHPNELTKEQRVRALSYLMFLKMKRNGTIKGRGCADGRKQREWMSKEDTTSPTISNEALMLSCMIDAMEGRDVATADIPGAFMQTPYDGGDVHIRIDGPMATLLAKIDPELYGPYMVKGRNGRSMMFAETKKALYGTVDASLLFWLKLSGSLKDMGFEMNPYDWCCMNKMINGKQCTILWHVDDIKISHVDSSVVTCILDTINDEYGKTDPLTVTRGKVHDYLGMKIDFSHPGKVKFTMIDYIGEILDALPEDMRGEMATPAAAHLFDVEEETPTLLSSEDATLFHHIVAKLLYLSKRARPDIQLAVAFLCTRVREPDIDDYKKLARLTKYIEATIGLPLILSIDGSGNIDWYVDAAFAVHKDMKSHTGGVMTMGQGAAFSQSSKQKLNTRSSTEAELVGVDDVMSQVVWSNYFLEAQGYFFDAKLHQDNQSAMKMENNGKRSSGKRTRHVNIRYYFVTDRISAGELSVEYCPTFDMIGDFATKPLQGSQFRRFRNVILGIHEDDIAQYNAEARAYLKKKKEDERQERLAADG